MTDLTKTIAPKSDQLNADDLVGGPVDILITGVWGNQGAADQPISIGFEGDEKRPYKPCKSMRRVLVAIWGGDGNQYVGRWLRLYCDPNVKFGGIAVGGIRISHASDIEKDTVILLTTSRSKRTGFNVARMEPKGAADQGQRSRAFDPERICIEAKSTADGGTDVYKAWFGGLNMEERTALKETFEKDPNDFDKEKPVHDICKAIAARADPPEQGEDF